MKRVINPSDPEHVRMVDASKDAGYQEAPVMVSVVADGTMHWIASGMSTFAIIRTTKYAQSLVDIDA